MGLNRGHYISVVKSHDYWFLFDDEQVEVGFVLNIYKLEDKCEFFFVIFRKLKFQILKNFMV